MARGLKFRILEVEGLYYPCSKNIGADQLSGHREADLHLCFAFAKSRFSHGAAHMNASMLGAEADNHLGTKLNVNRNPLTHCPFFI